MGTVLEHFEELCTCFAAVLPVVTGTCDDESYYVTVAYGSHGSDFKTIVGKRELTSDLATKYNVRENATHMTMSVPFFSSDVVFTVSVCFFGNLSFHQQVYFHY